ncbi:FtsH protease activity modulator HflK [Rubellimicrobium sp. CFH 75288]|uniref:FtsH protease activity modulator HflK n=1 Tax=Rubellimicrobium sp. CFH 75288 TaxID=2697034 RepID=UPI0014127544|nr:FtsH protease activity modulator HflK [Rubellimicrobium sp. CFH 75288]NAZ35486.1 FtsH protease activity modulator HflK [Rubellimicrobium sp. CFH 75288]
MANGGPWGGGGGRGPFGGGGGGGDDDRFPEDRRPPRRPGEPPAIPEIDKLVNRGREQLRVLMGGRGTGGPGTPPPQQGGPLVTRGTVLLGVLGLVVLWAFMSFYTVRPEERSVELFLGQAYNVGEPGLNFAPWPLVTYTVINVTSERTEALGANAAPTTAAARAEESGLMLTTDANIVDIGFQVVWNVADPEQLLFNIRDPELTVRAVSESVMREIMAASNLAPILNRDRGIIADTARERIQATLDAYRSGIRILRVNLDRADPPAEVIDAFRAVQAAEQERDRLQRQADAYANRVLAESRGQAAQIIEEAEAYRARTINDALGQASRFSAVLAEYRNAQEVTRERLYIETMERVLGDVGKIILDPAVAGGGNGNGGTGVVPFLPLNDMVRMPSGGTAGQAGAAAQPQPAPPAAAPGLQPQQGTGASAAAATPASTGGN